MRHPSFPQILLRAIACGLLGVMTANAQSNVVSSVDTSFSKYDRKVLIVDGQPFFYNGVQIRADKIRDAWQWNEKEINALFYLAKDDGFTVVNVPILWGEIQPDILFTPAKAGNLGAAALTLKADSSPDKGREGYLQFDFPGLTGNPAASVLRFYVSKIEGGPGTIEVYASDPDGKAGSVRIGAIPVKGADFYDLDVTDFIRSQFNGGKVGFILRSAPGSSAEITIDLVPAADARSGMKYVEFTQYVQKIRTKATDLPPTLRISRDDVYDWRWVDRYIAAATDAGLKLELLWFGSDTTNIAMDHRMPYYVFRNYQKALRKNGDPILEKKPVAEWTRGGFYWSYLDKTDSKLLAQEKQVLGRLFDHIAEYDAAHGHRKTVVGCQVNNETNVPSRMVYGKDSKHTPSSGAKWKAGRYTDFSTFYNDVRAEWLSELAGAVKGSKYSVWTRANNAEFLGSGGKLLSNGIAPNEKLRAGKGTNLDFYGMDFYRYSELDKLQGFLREQYNQGGNLAHVAESDWTLTGEKNGSAKRIPDYGILLALSANAAPNLYDLLGTDGHNFYIQGPDHTAIPGVKNPRFTAGAVEYDWVAETRNTNLMLKKAARALASKGEAETGGKQLAFFNQLARPGATVKKMIAAKEFEYHTDRRGVGIAFVHSPTEIVLMSKAEAAFTLPAGLLVRAASTGRFDDQDQWAEEGAKTPEQSGGRAVFRMKPYEVVKVMCN